MQDCVESGYRRYPRITKLLPRVLKALRPAENIDSEAAIADAANARVALRATYLRNAVLFSAEEHEILLHIDAVAANTEGRKQNFVLNGHVFCCCATFLRQDLNCLHFFFVKKAHPFLTSLYPPGFHRPVAPTC